MYINSYVFRLTSRVKNCSI